MKNPTIATVKRLFALSDNQCAFPECTNELVHGKKVTGKVCHIKGNRSGAKRYDKNQLDEERHGFDNLIIMCPIHHDLIDDDEIMYTVEVIVGYKKEHEARNIGGKEPNDDVAEALLGIRKVGIRSFMRGVEDLEQDVEALLDLVPHFEGRTIREAKLWHEQVFPQIEEFLKEQMQEDRPYHLYLPVHHCIGFATGYCLDAKIGVNAVPVQATSSGKIVWEPDDAADTEHPLWEINDRAIEAEGRDVAMILGVTHDAGQQATEFIESQLPSVHRIIECKILPQPSSRALRDGTHAFCAAEEVIQLLQSRRTAEERKSMLHIFTAAPVSFLFFLGQLSRVAGKCTLYEHDFGGTGAYLPSMTLPR